MEWEGQAAALPYTNASATLCKREHLMNCSTCHMHHWWKGEKLDRDCSHLQSLHCLSANSSS